MRITICLAAIVGVTSTLVASPAHADHRNEPDRRKRVAIVTLKGPSKVRDEHRVRLRVRWRTRSGEALSGRVVLQRRRGPAKRWHRLRSIRVRNGSASFRLRPRKSWGYRIVAPGGPTWRRDVSPPHRVKNKPRIRPVRLPRKAPRPRIKLRPQKRPKLDRFHPRIMRLPTKVWRSMVGRSWHRGCPVGRKRLRLIRMNYWGYDGYRHRGEIVVNQSIARKTVRAFRAIYRGKYPIRRMYRVDRFGWSKKLHGANDFKSMRAGNTSAFNCRSIVGRPGDLSPHALGRSVDINTWENPYHSARGYAPNRWWNFRSRPHRITYRSGGHPVVRAMRNAGFGWLGSADWQHFQIDTSGRAHRHDGGIFWD